MVVRCRVAIYFISCVFFCCGRVDMRLCVQHVPNESETTQNVKRSCKLLTPIMESSPTVGGLLLIDLPEKMPDAEAKATTVKKINEYWDKVRCALFLMELSHNYLLHVSLFRNSLLTQARITDHYLLPLLPR